MGRGFESEGLSAEHSVFNLFGNSTSRRNAYRVIPKLNLLELVRREPGRAILYRK